MSKAKTLTISVNPTDNNGQFSTVTSQFASFTSANTWADVSAGSGTNVTIIASNTEAEDLDPASTFSNQIFVAQYNGTRDNFIITRGLCIIDVSNINRNTDFLPKSINLPFGITKA